jgi:GNAT superfamily N-acetyltransferase
MTDRHMDWAVLTSRGPEYEITTARAKDVPLLPAVELAASRLFVGYAPEGIITRTKSVEAHEDARRHGQLWVALLHDAPVGFALVELIEPESAHLEELDVHPDHGRRGLGTRLIAAVCGWAASQRLRSVTLITSSDVPWNMPFYARLGFDVVPFDELTPALRSLFQAEAERGLDPAKRVVMQLDRSRFPSRAL